MRLRAIPSVTLIVVGIAVACAEDEGPSQELDLLGASGSATTGGNRASGGSAGSSSGGKGSGGNATLANGGTVSTGGTTTAGGSPSSGGSAVTGSGGAAGFATMGGQAGTGTGGNNSGGASSGGKSSVGGNGSGGTNAGGNNSGGTSNNTGGKATGGQMNEVHPPPIMNGQNAWASRYWDCCKPACGWEGNLRSGTPMTSCNKQNQSLEGNYEARNACESGGSAYMCWDGHPWAVSDKLAYGFAAASGGNYVCGRCFQLQFTGSGHDGNNAGVQGLNGKTMIVQVINNGGVESNQFDLLIPGGGVGLLNACTDQWGTNDLGAQYGGFLRGCNGAVGCVRNKCQTIFGNKPELMAGCEWFLGWFNAADNPNVVYKQIPCPQSIQARSGLSDPG